MRPHRSMACRDRLLGRFVVSHVAEHDLRVHSLFGQRLRSLLRNVCVHIDDGDLRPFAPEPLGNTEPEALSPEPVTIATWSSNLVIDLSSA